ncbi:MAG: hypothetical protein ACLRZ6_01185 [Lachnospiraceae bacterium]
MPRTRYGIKGTGTYGARQLRSISDCGITKGRVWRRAMVSADGSKGIDQIDLVLKNV